MKKMVWLAGVVLLLVFLSYSTIWQTQPDKVYLKDLFEHSQWRLPLSNRIMSDEQLYQYAGSFLVAGGEMFSVNPEVPPLGKYLYGWTKLLTGNPYLLTPILYLLSLAGFYYLSRKLSPSTQHQELSQALLITTALTPLLFTQLSQTMLDLPQLVFLLSHIFFLFQISNSTTQLRSLGLAIASGLSLGALAAIKIPILLPGLALLALFYLWRIKKLWLSIPLGITSGVIYLATYLSYFQTGHSLTEWFAAQKWMIQFYRQSRVEALPLLFPIAVLSGWYQNWSNDTWLRVSEWSLIWPLSFLGPGLVFLQLKAQKLKLNLFAIYIIGLTLLQFAINLILPFWPRYYLLILPFALLCGQLYLTSLSEKQRHRAVFGLLTLVVIEALLFIRPLTPNLGLAAENWHKGNYQDLYHQLSPATQQQLSRLEFHHRLKKVEHALNTPQVIITTPSAWPWQNQVLGTVTLTYPTPIGPFTQTAPLRVVRQGPTWAIEWSWDIVLPGFTPESEVVFMPEAQQVGRVLTKDEVVLSETGEVLALWLTPQLITSPETLRLTSEATGRDANELEAFAFVTALDSLTYPVGDLIKNEAAFISKLATTSGLTLNSHSGRVLTPFMTKRGISDWRGYTETEKPLLTGTLGGKVLLTTNGHSTTLLEVAPQNGQDLSLPQTSQELFPEPVVGKPE